MVGSWFSGLRPINVRISVIPNYAQISAECCSKRMLLVIFWGLVGHTFIARIMPEYRMGVRNTAK